MTIFEGISWVYWMLGTFGLVGTGLMLWLAPAALVQGFTYALKFFFGTRIGNILLTAIVVFIIADINRSKIDAAEYAAKIAEMQEQQIAAGKQRDADVAADTRAAVMAELARQRLTEAKIDSDVKEFTDALPPAPSSFTAATPDFRVGDAACRLRAIAGYAGCEPEGAAGRVSKARPKGSRARLPDWAQYRLPSIISRGPRESAQGQ